jgi:hypothetical protein
MEAARTSETVVHFYQTTRRYNPEDSHHQVDQCEHVDELEKQYCERKGITKERIESVIITDNGMSSSSSSSSSESDELRVKYEG